MQNGVYQAAVAELHQFPRMPQTGFYRQLSTFTSLNVNLRVLKTPT